MTPTPVTPAKPKFNWASFGTTLLKVLTVAASAAGPIIAQVEKGSGDAAGWYTASTQALGVAIQAIGSLQGNVQTPSAQ